MPLTNQQLLYYDRNVLRLPQEKRTLYTEQVNRLIDSLTEKIHENTQFKVSKVRKAGSFAKHTILRKAEGRKVDVDLGFYLEGKDISAEDYETLSAQIYEFLISMYPSKHIEDFVIQKKAATVTFVGSGLDVDIVPIIEDPNSPEYGWQFGTDGSQNRTCVLCQIQFMRERKEMDADFRTLVRLGKQWRHYNEVPGLKSFSIELVMAYLLDQEGKLKTLEQRFLRFLLHLAQSGLRDVISFPENTQPLGQFLDPVVIIDPVNSQNNVAGRISTDEQSMIATIAEASWETAHYASAENDNNVWKEVFGPRFKVAE